MDDSDEELTDDEAYDKRHKVLEEEEVKRYCIGLNKEKSYLTGLKIAS